MTRAIATGHRAIWFGLALLAAGCSLDPDYHRPAAPVPARFPVGGAYPAAKPGAPEASIAWETFFGSDPVLCRLIGVALANNRDLRVSTLNVLSARALYREQRGALFPELDAQGGFTESRTPTSVYSYGGASNTNAALGAIATTGSTATTGGGLSTGGTTLKRWSLGLGVSSYQVDLFGQVRSLSRAAFETALSDEETRRNAQISLIAQVADSYLALVADRQSLAVTQSTLDSQRHTLSLEQLTLDQGSGTAQSVAEAETSVRTAEASLAQYKRQAAQDLNALNLLLGAPLSPELSAALDRQITLDGRKPFPEVDAGLPSDLILRRPDIRAAEHTLLSANANIGAARANFFPQLTLTTSGGTASNELSNLFRAGQGNWSFAPSITFPIFDWGINAAKLDHAKTQKRIDVANYEKAIQTGFREVSDALASQDTYRDQLEAERRLVSASQRDYDLSLMRFHAGIDTYLTTLVSQRSLFSAQLTLVSVQMAQLESRITLYQALGGGW